ncbi:hypothetical protein D3C75_1248870 [compost metagenome]
MGSPDLHHILCSLNRCSAALGRLTDQSAAQGSDNIRFPVSERYNMLRNRREADLSSGKIGQRQRRPGGVRACALRVA